MSKGIQDFILEKLEKKRDLRDVAIVLPSLRPSFFLDRILAKEFSVVLPPKVFSIQRFWDYLLSELEDFHRVSFLDVLVDLKEVVQERIPEMADWKAFYPWAQPIFSAIEQVTLAMVPGNKLEQVHAILTGHGTEEEFYRFWKEMSVIRGELYRRLEDRRLFTRAMVITRLLARLDEVSLPFSRVIVAGLFLETEAERECLRRLKANNQVEICLLKVSVPGLEERFDLLAQSIAADQVWAVDLDTDKITVFPCRSELDEVDRVVRSLPRELSEPTEVGVVLPREELLMAFLDELKDVPYPVNISMGYPLKSTSGYDFLQRMIRVFEESSDDRLFYKDYLDLVSHFYLSELLPELTQVRSSLVRESQESGRVFFSLDEIESIIPSSAVERLSHLHQAIRAVLHEERVGELFGLLSDLFWWLIQENPGLEENELEREVAYRFYLALNQLLSSRLAEERLPARILFAYLRAVLTQEYIGFEGSPLEGLQVMGSLQARNLGFKHLHYLDLNEGMCPKGIGVDLFLPDPIREFLGMPRLRDREFMYAYDFYTTLALSDRVSLYYVRWPDGRFAVSRFVHQLRFLAQGKGKRLKEVEESMGFGVVLPKVEEEFEKHPQDLEKIKSYSPSALDTYLKCPVRFYYKYILSIPEPLEESEELDHREVGTLVHAILSGLYQPIVGEELNEAFFSSARKRLSAVAKRKAEELWGKVKYESVRGQAILQVVVRRIEDFLEVERERWKAERFKVVFAEKEGEEISLELELDGELSGVRLYGRADRIDKVGEEFVIWDYKTGTLYKPNSLAILSGEDFVAGELREHIKAVYRSLQLPMYVLLFTNSWSLSPSLADAGLISLKDLDYVRLFLTRSGQVRVSPERRKEMLDLVSEHIIGLIREIRDLSRPYRPDKTSCQYCPYRSACQVRGE